jgi:NADH:ubiquinone oxidoreductase subunit 5 (subunit L)/multisubunit Na+/H+ antiporter MnhA subunit
MILKSFGLFYRFSIGFDVLALGLGAYEWLFSRTRFFQSLFVLGSGSVIHAFGEQDMQHMMEEKQCQLLLQPC